MFQLHSLHIQNFRAIEQLRLDNLASSGVTVIHGENEAGKSTILDALRAVLSIKDTAKSREVKAFQPIGRDESPEVQARLSIGGVTLNIHKRWLKKTLCELNIESPYVANYTKGEANDKLAQLFPADLDKQLFDMLFLRQDDLGEGLEAAGISAFSQALNEATADNPEESLAESEGIFGAVEKEYLRYHTKSGQYKESLKRVTKDLEAAIDKRDAAQAEAKDLEAKVREVQQQQHSMSAAEKELPEAKQAAVESAQRRDEAMKLAERESNLQAAYKREVENFRRAEADVALRKQQVADIDSHKESLEQLRQRREEIASRAKEEKEAITRLSAQREELHSRRSQARLKQREAKNTLDLLSTMARREELSRVVEEAEAVNEKITELRQLQPAKAVQDSDVREAEEAYQELRIAEALKDQATPKLELKAKQPAEIEVDGQAVGLDEKAQHVVELYEGTTLAIGAVQAVFRAAGAADSSAELRYEKALEDMQTVLDKLGFEDVDAVRQARDAHLQLAQDLNAAKREAHLILQGRDLEDMKAEISRLRAELEGQEHIEDTSEDALNAAKRAHEDAGRQVDALEADIERVSQELEPWQQGRGATELVECDARIQQLAEQVAAEEEKLNAREAEASMQLLEDKVATVAAALNGAKQQWEEIAEKVRQEDPEACKAKAEMAAAKVSSIEDRWAKADRRLAELRGAINHAVGVSQEADEAATRVEQLQREDEELKARAQAASLLYETMLKHRQEARSKYAEPFARQLSKYASRIFGPDVSFDLTKDLEVASRNIDGRSVALEALSGGAKEQVSIVTRFAIAGMIAESGIDVPIIVDDALGSTDEQRIGRMNMLFNEMGKNHQVIVLTCMASRYDGVKNKQVYSMAELKAAG